MPLLPAPLDALPPALQRRALRLCTRPFAELPPAEAYRVAVAECEGWAERYPAVAAWLRRRVDRLRGRVAGR